MPDQSFQELRSHLLERGIAARQVRRITLELSDHLEDLQQEAMKNGLPANEARSVAMDRLGDQRVIAERILEHTEFKTWVYRYPRLARVYLPFACALLLPATPVIVGFRNPAVVARWGAALMLSGAVTAALFLFMQLSIVLT
jgi:hypothetical protein